MPGQAKKENRRPREDYEKKKVQKKKSTRGQCETEYGECKKNASYSVMPRGGEGFAQLSRILNMSRSETLEQIGRGKIRLLISSEGRDFIVTKDSRVCVELREIADENLDLSS